MVRGTLILKISMWLCRTLITLSFLLAFSIKSSASETFPQGQSNTREIYYKQVALILKFYDILGGKNEATVQDFFELFSEDDETELELRLRQDYPLFEKEVKDLHSEGENYAEEVYKKWYSNPEIKHNVDEIYLHPDRYSSRFLQCIKLIEPVLFSQKRARKLEFPPEITKDFTRYSVWLSSRRVIFEFVRDEYTIESVYLPNGKAIYTLIPNCRR